MMEGTAMFAQFLGKITSTGSFYHSIPYKSVCSMFPVNACSNTSAAAFPWPHYTIGSAINQLG